MKLERKFSDNLELSENDSAVWLNLSLGIMLSVNFEVCGSVLLVFFYLMIVVEG